MPDQPPRARIALRLEAVDPFDLDALVAASRALYADEGVPSPPERSLRIHLHRRLLGEARAALFRTPPEAAPVAFALWAPRGEAVRIEQFRVVPELRRRGWGRHCVEALLGGPLAGAPRVEVRVLADNRAAIAFWRALGFGAERRALAVLPGP